MENDDVNSYSNLSNSKLFTSLDFLGGFIDKKDQLKIVRDLSKKLYIKKDME